MRESIRAHYRQWYPLRAEALDLPLLNPGAGRVSKLCHEPRVALAVLESMLAPHIAAGRLTVLTHTRPVAADTEGDLVRAVTFEDVRDGARHTVTAPYVVDATETGELLELADVEHALGAEARSEYDEPHAPETADPLNQQGITVCFALSHHQGENHTVDRPDDYAFWRSYRPDFWPGPLLGFTAPDPRSLEAVTRTFEPNPMSTPSPSTPTRAPTRATRNCGGSAASSPASCTAPARSTPTSPSSTGRSTTTGSSRSSARARRRAGQPSPRRADSRSPSCTGSRPRPPVPTEAPASPACGCARRHRHRRRPRQGPYVRESRRIKAVTTVTEHDVAIDLVGPYGGTRHRDSVGVGGYRIDLHPSTGGDNYIDIGSVPFEIPLGALVPRRVRNLLPAGKNIGTTHITNGCYRLHPVEWNIGEVAGALAAHCLDEGVRPHQVQEEDKRLEEFTRVLDRAGVQRHWPDVRGY
ncbi:FAD-dependent oxidoreductase [Streptomyces microflavus]|nr:FAD-dependent oxidoreductase [Streptomyces microflavus]